MNEIWSQADIRLELETIEPVEVPKAILQRMLAGDLAPFFNEIGDGITLQQFSNINGFYIRRVGGPNGINLFRSRTFFVIDEPSVFDRRVSSHEIGHTARATITLSFSSWHRIAGLEIADHRFSDM